MDGTQSFPEIVKLLIENGLQSTLILFFLTLIFGLILGMIIAKGRMSKLLIIQMPIRFFLLIMRGTPLILQLYGFYFVRGRYERCSPPSSLLGLKRGRCGRSPLLL